MARYTESQCRLCRREGEKLYLKGDRCYGEKCSFAKRSYAPGQHGAAAARKKRSEYGLQLREKEKVRRIYGVLEKPFRKYYVMATKKHGITGEELLSILETRLDNVVFRLGLANTRREARQIVNHGHILVNGSKVDIPSYLVKVGDTVELREKSKGSVRMKEIAEANATKVAPKWLDMDKNASKGKVIALPARDDIDYEVEEHLIVELYSK